MCMRTPRLALRCCLRRCSVPRITRSARRCARSRAACSAGSCSICSRCFSSRACLSPCRRRCSPCFAAATQMQRRSQSLRRRLSRYSCGRWGIIRCFRARCWSSATATRCARRRPVSYCCLRAARLPFAFPCGRGMRSRLYSEEAISAVSGTARISPMLPAMPVMTS